VIAPQKELLRIDDLDFFGDNQKKQVTPVKEVPKQQQPQQQSGGGLLDFFMGSGSKETPENKKGSILSLFSDKIIEPTLQKDIPVQSFTNSSINDNIILSKDTYMTVGSKRVKKNDLLQIELTFTCNTGFSLTQLNCQFQPPEKFSLDFETNSQCTIRSNSINISILEPGSPILLSLKLTLQDPGFGTQLMGSISYSDPKQNKQLLSISTKIDISDLLTPVALTTQSYGQNWKIFTLEKKNVFTGSPPMDVIEKVIKEKLKGQVVSVIGTEVISAVKIISLNKICLMHVKNSKGIFFTIKSESSNLNEKISLYAKQCFEN